MTGAETVCASQTISGSSSVVATAEGVSASVAGAAAQAPVTLSCNTAAVAANGAVTFTNGPKMITAKVYNASGTLINSASNTVRLNFTNASGFSAMVTNTPTTPAFLRPADGTAVSTNDGLLYRQGSLTITLTGVNFNAGQTANFATVAGNLTLASGTGPTPIALTFTQVAGTQNFTATVSAATLATAQGTYNINITGSTTSGGSTGPTALSGTMMTRVDNVAPTSTGSFAPALVSNFFVNGAYAFASSNAALFVAPTAPADAGVGGTQVKFFAGTPAQITALSGTTPNVSSLTEITTGGQLDSTLVNNAYGVAAITYDKLGNFIVQKLGVNFGVDKVAPMGLAFDGASPADSTASTANVTYAYNSANFTDDASGFGNSPLRVKVQQTTASGTTCAVGTGASCTAAAQAPGYSFTSTANGYYNVTTTLQDTAGNVTAPVMRMVLVDNTAPTFTGGLTVPGSIADSGSVSFTPTINDNLDLKSAQLSVRYASITALAANGIRVDSASLGSYGMPLTLTASPTLTVNPLWATVQMVNGAGLPLAPTANDTANAVVVRAVDVAGNAALLTQALPSSQITTTEKDFTTSGIASFAVTNAATNVKNTTGAANPSVPTTVTLTAQVQASSLAVNNPFDSVVFWYVDGASGMLVRIGSASAAVQTDNSSTRFFTYSLSWDPPASLGSGGSLTIVATGVKGSSALVTQANTNITLVP